VLFTTFFFYVKNNLLVYCESKCAETDARLLPNPILESKKCRRHRMINFKHERAPLFWNLSNFQTFRSHKLWTFYVSSQKYKDLKGTSTQTYIIFHCHHRKLIQNSLKKRRKLVNNNFLVECVNCETWGWQIETTNGNKSIVYF
jgi:hypothetical protein